MEEIQVVMSVQYLNWATSHRDMVIEIDGNKIKLERFECASTHLVYARTLMDWHRVELKDTERDCSMNQYPKILGITQVHIEDVELHN